MRGGVSTRIRPAARVARSSPRAWGCFLRRGPGFCRVRVFPTCVGVFPGHKVLNRLSRGLPHVRGGVSVDFIDVEEPIQSSPRAWGCFWNGRRQKLGYMVFPTCVGVFPAGSLLRLRWPRLPHVRGGVSETSTFARGDHQSSPRAWGCFFPVVHAGRLTAVFPTCVGVFLFAKHVIRRAIRLPHVRGGVSSSALMRKALRPSSPRAWGCFRWTRRIKKLFQVFPTCVGVFLKSRYRDGHSCSLPHVRGGVSGSLKFLLM